MERLETEQLISLQPSVEEEVIQVIMKLHKAFKCLERRKEEEKLIVKIYFEEKQSDEIADVKGISQCNTPSVNNSFGEKF